MSNGQEMGGVSEPGKRLGHYELLDQLGQGGMAVVYLGVQSSLNRKVAVKVLPVQFAQSKELVGRFDREAQIAAQLNHPNIVQIIDRGKQDDTLYIVMEYVDGESLDRIMARGELTIGKIVEYSLQICEALEYAHGKGIVHRDLKPSNIMIDRHTGRAKITDFGIAQLTDHAAGMSTLTTQNAALGTINYMSPEQRTDSHTVTHRTDIFSFGVMLYQMLTGKLPLGHFKLPSQLNHDIPMGFDAIVKKCLQENPDERYQSAIELRAALADITGWQTKYKDLAVKVQHSVRQIGTRTSPIIRGNRWFWVAATGIVALIAVVVLANRNLFKITSRDAESATGESVVPVASKPESEPGLISEPSISSPEISTPVPTRAPPTPTINPSVILEQKLKKQIAAAESLLSEGNPEQALEMLRSIVEANKTHSLSARAQLLIGETHEKAKDLETAIKEYEFLVRLFPRSPQAPRALFNSGIIYSRMGKTSEDPIRGEHYARSLQAFRQILNAYPDSPEAPQASVESTWIKWKSMEKKGVFKKKFDKAEQLKLISELRETLDQYPTGGHVISTIRLIAQISVEPELEDYFGAAEMMMTIYQKDPDRDSDSLYQACRYYMAAGDSAAEGRACRIFMDKFPKDSRAAEIAKRMQEIPH
ncbi:protein kinase [bacterium]|nr:protein kinase [candidate division CSSED10-310 bacterium]